MEKYWDRMMKEGELQQQIEQAREPDFDIKEWGRTIHFALSNRDAYEIFCLTADGINASTNILREQSFSRKRYYTRLKGLVDLGLVHKEGGKYKHTALGSIVYEIQVNSLESALEHIAISKAQDLRVKEFT
jgi:predicted transcriptional regulator